MTKAPYLLVVPLLLVCGCQSKNAEMAAQPIPPKPGTIFDLPALLDKDLTLAIAQLGEPVSATVLKAPDNFSKNAMWKRADGSTLGVSYDTEGKKMYGLSFTMPEKTGTLNKGKLLRAGNLSLNDPRYSLKFYIGGLAPAQIAGVILRPTSNSSSPPFATSATGR